MSHTPMRRLGHSHGGEQQDAGKKYGKKRFHDTNIRYFSKNEIFHLFYTLEASTCARKPAWSTTLWMASAVRVFVSTVSVRFGS